MSGEGWSDRLPGRRSAACAVPAEERQGSSGCTDDARRLEFGAADSTAEIETGPDHAFRRWVIRPGVCLRASTRHDDVLDHLRGIHTLAVAMHFHVHVRARRYASAADRAQGVASLHGVAGLHRK